MNKQLNNDEYFMRLAIKEALKSKESVGCGVVIVKYGRVFSKSFNKQRVLNDATAHAEINAIRIAGKKISNKNLEGCTIYCTCEPCMMCLSAIVFSKISKLVYGTSMKKTFPNNLPINIDIDYFLSKIDVELEVSKGFMKDDCKKLLI